MNALDELLEAYKMHKVASDSFIDTLKKGIDVREQQIQVQARIIANLEAQIVVYKNMVKPLPSAPCGAV